jgi:hypothetical protein
MDAMVGLADGELGLVVGLLAVRQREEEEGEDYERAPTRFLITTKR